MDSLDDHHVGLPVVQHQRQLVSVDVLAHQRHRASTDNLGADVGDASSLARINPDNHHSPPMLDWPPPPAATSPGPRRRPPARSPRSSAPASLAVLQLNSAMQRLDSLAPVLD